ncbi:MAG: helix-turn-helix domain-containing protein [Elusimicrobia bacterium]|nr:helix-turn-helix domain-containing protein [Elusimicrobiota bacterium]
MLEKETRTAILTLAAKGRKQREIARALGVSRNSVKRVLREQTAQPNAKARASCLDEHLEAIRALHAECRDDKGRPNLVRVMEKLQDKLKAEGKVLDVPYSTLTWFCREHGIEEKVPWTRIVTGPGEEMQHDTSPCTVKFGEAKFALQCASLVLGYSRMLYVQFYPRFQRFHLKVFLTDAFTHLGGCCRRCVIDNTSIAISCGSGSRAKMAAEVEAFEDTFRNTKQCLGGEDPQTWKGHGPERAASLSLWIYAAVWQWYIKTHGAKPTWFPTPWYPGKTTPSFADALAALRRALWGRRIFARSDSRPLPRKFAAILIGALAEAT